VSLALLIVALVRQEVEMKTDLKMAETTNQLLLPALYSSEMAGKLLSLKHARLTRKP
jgi:hypothetical protein